jgi:hypothetical protein
MAKKETPQGLHDKKTRQVANSAKARGRRDVRADLPGFRKPKPIGGKIPDVTWQKRGGGLAVREIDPPGKPRARDRAQHRKLKREAERRGLDYRRLKYGR